MGVPSENASSSDAVSQRKPLWLRRTMAHRGKFRQINNLIDALHLHTVCREAACPNRSECFSCGTATFLVMGAVCTRTCAFCGVEKGTIAPLDLDEIPRLVEAVRAMRLRHAVITSVTRDDLHDGGASFFATLVAALRRDCPDTTVELLIPDLKGDHASQDRVFASAPDILNHNIETVPALYPALRPQAQFERSLELIRRAANAGLLTKSGIMVGLGETEAQVLAVLDELHENGCSIITIGQYLQPSPNQAMVKEFIEPERFDAYRRYGMDRGFLDVVAGPFVRSSYHAADQTSHIRNRHG